MARLRTLTLCFFATCLVGREVVAQAIDYSIGARAGFLLNQRNIDTTTITSTQNVGVVRDDSPRYVFGPTFEIGFKQRLAIEFSPTYRREGATFYSDLHPASIPPLPPGGLAVVTQFSRQSESVWDLPLVGKYYFTGMRARIRPFAGIGATASRRSSETEVYSQFQNDSGDRSVQTFTSHGTNWGFGPVVSGGVAFRSGRISLVPEFRYLRDNRAYFSGSRDRAEIFLGFRF